MFATRCGGWDRELHSYLPSFQQELSESPTDCLTTLLHVLWVLWNERLTTPYQNSLNRLTGIPSLLYNYSTRRGMHSHMSKDARIHILCIH